MLSTFHHSLTTSYKVGTCVPTNPMLSSQTQWQIILQVVLDTAALGVTDPTSLRHIQYYNWFPTSKNQWVETCLCDYCGRKPMVRSSLRFSTLLTSVSMHCRVEIRNLTSSSAAQMLCTWLSTCAVLCWNLPWSSWVSSQGDNDTKVEAHLYKQDNKTFYDNLAHINCIFMKSWV